MSKVIESPSTRKLGFNSELKKLSGYYTINVTPELAKLWLGLNPRNRPLAEANVLEYKKRMRNREWVLNGQALIFSSDGLLLDGQHRLAAVVRYGKPVKFDVRFGVDPTAFSTLDDGSRRKAADVLAIENIPNYSNAASAIGYINGLLMNTKSRHMSRHKRMSNQKVLEWYQNHPEIADFVLLGLKWYDASARILSASKFAAYAYVFSLVDAEKAMKFLNQLAFGTNLSLNSSVYHLRNRLLRSKFDKHNRLASATERALIIKAFNFFVRGQTE